VTTLRDLTIAICTHNREDDLLSTVAQLAEGELRECPLIIGDDCSDKPVDLALKRACTRDVHVLRSERRIGLINQRNLLVAEATTPFVLILDDDSSPKTGGLLNVMALFQQPEVVAVGMPVQLTDGSWQIEPALWGSRRRAYFGCAHILRREAFLALGGYRGELVHQGEEKDFGIRALASGLACVHASQPVVEHRLSTKARSFERMDYYGSRNDLLFVDWYAAAEIWPREVARALARRFIHFAKYRRRPILAGLAAWLRDRKKLVALRSPVSKRQWRDFHNLPY
jgi:GT2 family glycosyltransferase